MLICYFPLQVLEQLNVFAEEDVNAAAEALNDVSVISWLIFYILFFTLLPKLRKLNGLVILRKCRSCSSDVLLNVLVFFFFTNTSL